MRRIFKRICWALLVLVAVFLVFGYCYERAALKSIANDFPPPGKLVDIGGRSIHLNVQGQGSPTVIFESGLGSPSVVWDLVAPEVAKSTRVVTHDRAGLGWSDPSPGAGADSIVSELHKALEAADIEGPYVLVGHSIGGMYARLFSYRYPSDVVGIVLVDSSHEDQFDRFPAEMQRGFRRIELIVRLAARSAWCGIPRMWFELRGGGGFDETLPEESRTVRRKLATSRATLRAAQHEFDSLPDIGNVVMAEQIAWNDLPLVVLTAGEQMPGLPAKVSAEEMRELWIELQQELASRSINSTHRIIDCSHNIQLERPKIVIDEILRLVDAIRSQNTDTEL